MDSTIPLDEFHQKIPTLQDALIKETATPLKCYYYTNISEDALFLTLLIFVYQNNSTYRFSIYLDSHYKAEDAPKEIIQVVDSWLLNMKIVKARQIERAQLIKEELIRKVWHPDNIAHILSQ